MTKKELVELLKDVPDDSVVVIPGHSDSDGYENASSVDEVEVFEYHDWSGDYHPYGDYAEKSGFKKLIVIAIC